MLLHCATGRCCLPEPPSSGGDVFRQPDGSRLWRSFGWNRSVPFKTTEPLTPCFSCRCHLFCHPAMLDPQTRDPSYQRVSCLARRPDHARPGALRKVLCKMPKFGVLTVGSLGILDLVVAAVGPSPCCRTGTKKGSPST